MADCELPAGNVTLLFTDIEGSTRLIEELGESGYIGAPRSTAVFCARRSQRTAASRSTRREMPSCTPSPIPWRRWLLRPRVRRRSRSGPVRVRMGLHTGELQLTGEGYAGRELHRAARIAASGHGGQVVVSAATRASSTAS